MNHCQECAEKEAEISALREQLGRQEEMNRKMAMTADRLFGTFDRSNIEPFPFNHKSTQVPNER